MDLGSTNRTFLNVRNSMEQSLLFSFFSCTLDQIYAVMFFFDVFRLAVEVIRFDQSFSTVQDNPIEPQHYYELFEKDTIKFGNSR